MVDDIVGKIDLALAKTKGIKPGSHYYAEVVSQYLRSRGGDKAYGRMCDAIVDYAAAQYLSSASPLVELLTFTDRNIEFLVDAAQGRTILVHGRAQDTAPNSRDNSYHAGYARRQGFDKGHAFAHAQGGFEGGPNYFFQRPQVNRRLSALGHLWRDIETHLAANPGAFAFVRLIYAGKHDVPKELEYGLIASNGQFRSVLFPN